MQYMPSETYRLVCVTCPPHMSEHMSEHVSEHVFCYACGPMAHCPVCLETCLWPMCANMTMRLPIEMFLYPLMAHEAVRAPHTIRDLQARASQAHAVDQVVGGNIRRAVHVRTEVPEQSIYPTPHPTPPYPKPSQGGPTWRTRHGVGSGVG